MNTVLEALPFEFEAEYEAGFEAELESGFEFESTTQKPPSRRAAAAAAASRVAPSPAKARDPYQARPPGASYASKKPEAMSNKAGGLGPRASTSGTGSSMVRQVQQRLNQILGLRLPLNGLLDVPSRSALRRFQSWIGLPATGMLDPQTRSKLTVPTPARPGTPGTPGRAQAGTPARPPSGTSGRAPSGPPRTTPVAIIRPAVRRSAWPYQAAPAPYFSPGPSYPLFPCQCQCGQASGQAPGAWPQNQGPDQVQAQDQGWDQDQGQSQDQGTDQGPGPEQDPGQGQEEYWF
jgi:Putative peptidoglycan binding domain